MKRIVAFGGITLMLLLLVVATVPAQNTAGRLAHQDGYNLFTVLQTFNGGANVTSGDVSVASGNKFRLNGGASTTYLQRDPDTGCWQEWKDGTLGWQLCSDGVVPPDCTSAGPMEFGKFCKDQPTVNHGARVLMNTGSGIVVLSGTTP